MGMKNGAMGKSQDYLFFFGLLFLAISVRMFNGDGVFPLKTCTLHMN